MKIFLFLFSLEELFITRNNLASYMTIKTMKIKKIFVNLEQKKFHNIHNINYKQCGENEKKREKLIIF